eukprot:m.299533 g.299533  ORF g.299533 m.299533 type:complete len:52 (+) comp27236_c0_seq2:220-375(+)
MAWPSHNNDISPALLIRLVFFGEVYDAEVTPINSAWNRKEEDTKRTEIIVT